MGLDSPSTGRSPARGKPSTLHRSSPLAGYVSHSVQRAQFSRGAVAEDIQTGYGYGAKPSVHTSVPRASFSQRTRSGPGSAGKAPSSAYYTSQKQYEVDVTQESHLEDDLESTLAEEALAESDDPNTRMMLERLRNMSARHHELAHQFAAYRGQADMVVRTLRQKLEEEQEARKRADLVAEERIEDYKRDQALKARELVVMETKLNEMSLSRRKLEERLANYRSEHARHIQVVETQAQRAREGATHAAQQLTRREGREAELQSVLDFMKEEHEKDLESVLLELQDTKHHNTKLSAQLADHRAESLNVRVLEQATLQTALAQLTDTPDFTVDSIRASLLRIKAAVTKRCNDLEAELIGERARCKELAASMRTDQNDTRWESEDAPIFFSHRVKELEAALHEARTQIDETEAHLTDTFLAAKEEWKRRAAEYERQIDLLDEQMRQMPLEARFGSAVSAGDASARLQMSSSVIMQTSGDDNPTTIRRLVTALDAAENKAARLESLVAHVEDELRETKVKCSEFELLCQRREDEYTALAQEKAQIEAQYVNASVTKEQASVAVEDGRSRMLDEAEEQEDLIQALQTRVEDLTQIQEESVMSNVGQDEMTDLHGAIPNSAAGAGAGGSGSGDNTGGTTGEETSTPAPAPTPGPPAASDDNSALPPPPSAAAPVPAASDGDGGGDDGDDGGAPAAEATSGGDGSGQLIDI